MFQRRGLRHKTCKEMLKEMKMFRLKKRKMKGKMPKVFKYMKGNCTEERVNCSFMCSGHRGRINGHKGRFRLVVRKAF